MITSTALLVLALTFDRAGQERTCHGDQKRLHSSAYVPDNRSPLHTAQCDASVFTALSLCVNATNSS